MSSDSVGLSPPELPVESAGSSVSSSLQKEYEELLRYAVVTPKVLIPSQPVEKVSKMPQYSSTSTELTSESYETDSKDIRREVSGLPTTPVLARNLPEPDMSDSQATSEMLESKGYESFSSSQSTPPADHVTRSPSVDVDLVRMETQLDTWCLDMKRNILAEFAQCKMALFERHRQALREEKQRHAAELNKQQNEVQSLKELLYTYEKTTEHKDQIIGNMTKAVNKQKERFDLFRRFSVWKLKHMEEKKEGFGMKLASKHNDRVLKSKLMSAWRGQVETKWKQKVEKACQSKAQDVCVKLTDEYEAKLQEANQALEVARLEIGRLHAEREIYEETMKKAFMRGVCALNLEAMHMFREPGEEGEHTGESCGSCEDRASTDSGNEMNPRSQAPQPSSTAELNRRGVQNLQVTQNKPSSSGPAMSSSGMQAAGLAGRTINVRAVGRPDFRPPGKTTSVGGGLPGASTVSSVLVQRHSGPDAIPAKTILRKPSQNTTKSSSSKVKGAIRTSHVPPVKVVQ